jgi:DnaJ-domain-containing protein 1
MSPTEILVVIGGLALGYWVVKKLMDDLNRDEKNPLGPAAPPSDPSSAPDDSRLPWHEVLKVRPDATPEEIRRSYQLLIEQYHPDKAALLGDEPKAQAERKSREIDAAYRQAILVRGE